MSSVSFVLLSKPEASYRHAVSPGLYQIPPRENFKTLSMEMIKLILLFLLMVTMMVGRPVAAADPDITTDFGINVTSGAQLHFTGFRDLPDSAAKKIVITFAFDTQFPGVTGLGLATSLLKFGPSALNSVHHHPRASEVFYIIDGEIDAGVVDTKNNLFTATLKKGDVFVFPKGLMHFQINRSGSPLGDFVITYCKVRLLT
ncbi:hypothetical protein MARPO_0180s0002 [Marchantia polymorpha]|uniref:Germin-like protein n=1 Tax=Marchantia polymorpha TaxID=3197 RepID=A0A2R6W1Z0_MARPO|nr:hypothetical protein MARPO_0180s0002 [Marchantia polymorpha]|eukprot:PTQ27877.1 hypothetical protein MARPO_0180s0002 [Marchantia polymorpha]